MFPEWLWYELPMKFFNRIRSLIVPPETIHGYEQPELIEVIFQKTKAYRPNSAWNESAKTVLDFGGGCGLHYKEAALDAKWAIVETPAMVQRAQELATERLQFFTNIKTAQDWLGQVDLMHSNGALQYTQEPEATLAELVSLRAKVMLWKRVGLSTSEERSLQISNLRDNGPGKISIRDKLVTYPVTRISERSFLLAHRGYRLVEQHGSDFRFVKESE
jgi:putative methyltransferase (TIGR04325 family)